MNASPPRLEVSYTLEQCWHAVPGGTAAAAIEVARAIQERGDVELLGVAAWHRHPPADAWTPPVPVRSLWLPRLGVYEGWRWLRWPAIGRGDVVHATTLLVPPRRRRPLVVTIHDLAFRHDPDQFTPHGVRSLERGLAHTIADADVVLCSSLATERDVREAGVEAARTRVVPLGVRPVATTPQAIERAKAEHGLVRPYLAFLGTVEPRKNLARVLAAAAAHQATHDLVVIGPQGWGPQLPTSLTSSVSVRLLGFVAEATKAALLAGADALVYPSLREGFGLPVLEAMALGTPVVTSLGTSTEEVGRGAAVLVDPLDVDAVAAGIAEAFERRLELAAAGWARAAEYPWSRTAALTVAAYREVAGR